METDETNMLAPETLNAFNAMLQKAVSPLLVEIRALRTEIDDVKKCKQVETISIPKQVNAKTKRSPKEIAINPKSYAEILSENQSTCDMVRNITIKRTDDEIATIMMNLKKDDKLADISIDSIKDT